MVPEASGAKTRGVLSLGGTFSAEAASFSDWGPGRASASSEEGEQPVTEKASKKQKNRSRRYLSGTKYFRIHCS